MLEDVVTFFVEIMLELIPLFLLITFLIGLSLEYISPDKLQRFLSGKRRVTGIVLATILGYVTPFCSCSTVPVAAGMLGASIPLGVVVAFVFASPYPIEIGAIVLGPVFGWHLAIIFSVVGLVIALLMGLIVNKLDWRDQISSGFKQLVYPRIRNRKNVTENVVQSSSSGYNSLESEPNQCDGLPSASIQECECENPTNEGNLVTVLKNEECECENPTNEGNLVTVLKNAMMYSLGFLKKMFLYVLVGSLVGALIYGYMPEEIILQYAGSANLFAVPLAAIIGIPLYMSSSSIIPIIYSLYLKGMSGGAVTALLITATAISPPEIMMLSKMFKKKIMITFILTMVVGAIAVGYLSDSIGAIIQ